MFYPEHYIIYKQAIARSCVIWIEKIPGAYNTEVFVVSPSILIVSYDNKHF